MYIEDFIYDETRASDVGFMVCSFNNNSKNEIDMGSNISFNTVKIRDVNYMIDYTYNESITCSFCVCKKIDDKNIGDEFTAEEIEFVMKWLNREEFLKFQPIYNNDNFHDIYYIGTFNEIKLINIAGRTIGFRLTFISNAPYGFSMPREYKYSNVSEFLLSVDDSSYIGYMYPEQIKITCLQAGDLVVTNDKDNKVTKISNCKVNEEIVIDSNRKIITSSGHDRLHNDFNYHYPRIYNGFNSEPNKFTLSYPCNIEIVYYPIRKVGIQSYE